MKTELTLTDILMFNQEPITWFNLLNLYTKSVTLFKSMEIPIKGIDYTG